MPKVLIFCLRRRSVASDALLAAGILGVLITYGNYIAIRERVINGAGSQAAPIILGALQRKCS